MSTFGAEARVLDASDLRKVGTSKLADIRERQRAETERLWGVFGQVLAAAQEATERR